MLSISFDETAAHGNIYNAEEACVRLTFCSGVGVGMGSRPLPGSKLCTGAEGAKSDKALASSGIFPAGYTQTAAAPKTAKTSPRLCLSHTHTHTQSSKYLNYLITS